MTSEVLSNEELAEITGSPRRKEQLEWLDEHGWVYTTTRAQMPVVGRLYARMRLAGLDPSLILENAGIPGKKAWAPDFTKLQVK